MVTDQNCHSSSSPRFLLCIPPLLSCGSSAAGGVILIATFSQLSESEELLIDKSYHQQTHITYWWENCTGLVVLKKEGVSNFDSEIRRSCKIKSRVIFGIFTSTPSTSRYFEIANTGFVDSKSKITELITAPLVVTSSSKANAETLWNSLQISNTTTHSELLWTIGFNFPIFSTALPIDFEGKKDCIFHFNLSDISSSRKMFLWASEHRNLNP